MTTESLEEKFAKLEREVERLKAVDECMRLMGRYCYLHATGRQKEIADMYATKTTGVKIYVGEAGVYEGLDAPDRVWRKLISGEGLEGMSEEDRAGMIFLHPNETPLIEVAGDGKTAKGMWISDGIESGKNRRTGQLEPAWGWGVYGVDFVKEDGKWKFWHFHMYRWFRAPYDGGGWTAFDADDPEGVLHPPEGLEPDGPAVDDCPYRPNKVWVFRPDPPEPYETFDETFSY
jgi:hypothetical protein